MTANQNNTNPLLKILSVSLVVLILDQVTKILTKNFMTLRESKQIIGDTVRLTFIENDGMAFGIAIGNKLLFNLFSIIAAAAILWYLIKLRNEHLLPRFALAIIFGGAIGNLFDRIVHGRVVDFMDINIPDIPSLNLFLFSTPPMNRWPIFNVADVAVSIGMVLLIGTLFTSTSIWQEYEPGAEPATVDEKAGSESRT
ncbi:signal peptidase II [candidate division KSB1 bacterium]